MQARQGLLISNKPFPASLDTIVHGIEWGTQVSPAMPDKLIDSYDIIVTTTSHTREYLKLMHYVKPHGLLLVKLHVDTSVFEGIAQAEADIGGFQAWMRLLLDTQGHGAVFCHGRKHNPIDWYFLRLGLEWYYVDRRAVSQPDIVGDLMDPNIISTLPGMTVIIGQSCTIKDKAQAITYAQRAYSLLIPGGVFYTNNFEELSLFWRSRANGDSIEETRLLKTEDEIEHIDSVLNDIQYTVGFVSWSRLELGKYRYIVFVK